MSLNLSGTYQGERSTRPLAKHHIDNRLFKNVPLCKKIDLKCLKLQHEKWFWQKNQKKNIFLFLYAVIMQSVVFVSFVCKVFNIKN